MNIYANTVNPLIILIIIIAVAASIALVAYLIYRFMHPKIKQDNEEVDEKKAAKEELERILQPVEDEEIAEEIANYVDDKDE